MCGGVRLGCGVEGFGLTQPRLRMYTYDMYKMLHFCLGGCLCVFEFAGGWEGYVAYVYVYICMICIKCCKEALNCFGFTI